MSPARHGSGSDGHRTPRAAVIGGGGGHARRGRVPDKAVVPRRTGGTGAAAGTPVPDVRAEAGRLIEPPLALPIRAGVAEGAGLRPPDGVERHPIQELWDEFDSLPGGAFAGRRVEPLRPSDRLAGIAFFPVGSGLRGRVERGTLPPLPPRTVMVLGNNFPSRRSCDWVVAHGGEDVGLDGTIGNVSPTWRRLLALLEDAGIPRESCFFTNCYMALVVGDSNTGTLVNGQVEVRGFGQVEVRTLRPSRSLS